MDVNKFCFLTDKERGERGKKDGRIEAIRDVEDGRRDGRWRKESGAGEEKGRKRQERWENRGNKWRKRALKEVEGKWKKRLEEGKKGVAKFPKD